MSTRTITLLTGTVETRKTLHAQLEDIIGDFVQIESFSLDDPHFPRMIKNKIIILSTHLIEEEVRDHIGSDCQVIVANRIANYEHIDKLLAFPSGTKALYVNDFPETVSESIGNLIDLGIDNIEYIPYYPGKKNILKVPLAITPGEVDLVPEYVTEVVNIGPRLIDLTTITQMIRKLKLPEQKGLEISKRFIRKIIELSKKLAHSNYESGMLNQHFMQVLDGVNDGILAIDGKGRITVFNDFMESALKINSRFAIGKPLKDIIASAELEQYMLSSQPDSEDANQVFTVNGIDFMVQRLRLRGGDATVATFKDVHETIKMERTLRRELVKKGFVAKYNFKDIVGESAILRKTKEIACKLSKNDLTVLIEGESGTGKELFASAMHNESMRSGQTFLAINFSALPEDLIESELFGFEDGAFTGARKGGKTGLFEQASGGTIFLDEIGDISLKIQARLLRVLQEKEIMRIGGSKIIPVNVRVIAATNKDLLQMIELGKFREDLYHRLKVLYVHLPELRRRKEDIENLINHFIRMGGRSQVKVLPEVLDRLKQYEWYGNIRELRNTIDYMLAVCEDDIVTLDDIPEDHFFQKSAPTRRGELVYRSDSAAASYAETPKPAAAEPPMSVTDGEDMHFILQKVYEHNRVGSPIGRQKLAELSASLPKPMSEQQTRRRVELMERQGLLIVIRGRSGIKLTQAGLALIKGAGLA